MSRLFRFWTRQQLIDALIPLEQGIASGQAQIAYPNAGSIVTVDFATAERIASRLNDRLDVLDGTAPARGRSGVRFIRHLPFG